MHNYSYIKKSTRLFNETKLKQTFLRYEKDNKNDIKVIVDVT